MDVAYVLANKIDEKHCSTCFGMWIRFRHGEQVGIYRFSPVEPAACPTCNVLDKNIEADPGFIASEERWFEYDI